MEKIWKERIIEMAKRTWDVIGGDTLRCLEEEGVDPVIPREEVIEVVCDAGYMKMYGNDKEAYEVWNKLPTYDEKMAAVKGAFPFEMYGW